MLSFVRHIRFITVITLAVFTLSSTCTGSTRLFNAWKDSEIAHEIVAGYAYSPIDDKNKPSFSYLNSDFRRIWKLYTQDRTYSGYSIVGAVWLGKPVGDFGSAMAGIYGGLRRDWSINQNSAYLYVEVLLGCFITDAHEERNQRLIGSFLEFHEDIRIGLRSNKPAFKQWLPFIEVGLQHISNAGLGKRNQGVNSVTINLGVQL
ncbi:MAG: acyloxyacyl hydrolase [Verrucomicrobia bacterium]|nr:acyloxyacyl hydrolase [Verrucomicrobiota bacterium]